MCVCVSLGAMISACLPLLPSCAGFLPFRGQMFQTANNGEEAAFVRGGGQAIS